MPIVELLSTMPSSLCCTRTKDPYPLRTRRVTIDASVVLVCLLYLKQLHFCQSPSFSYVAAKAKLTRVSAHLASRLRVDFPHFAHSDGLESVATRLGNSYSWSTNRVQLWLSFVLRRTTKKVKPPQIKVNHKEIPETQRQATRLEDAFCECLVSV